MEFDKLINDVTKRLPGDLGVTVQEILVSVQATHAVLDAAGIPRKADNGEELPLYDRVIQLSSRCQGQKEIATLYRSLIWLE